MPFDEATAVPVWVVADAGLERTPRLSDPAARHGVARRAGVVLAIVCSAQLILAVDITIILVADVKIKHALGFGEADLSWLG